MSTVCMTIHDRTPEVIRAVFAGLSLPGNTPDKIAVCFDRAPQEAVATFHDECGRLRIKELREHFIDDPDTGPRCPSRAWNRALDLVTDSHALCISSEMVLTPHSLGMAYHLSKVAPESVIVGRAEHCGQSYTYTHTLPSVEGAEYTDRTMTCAHSPAPLGFVWLLPMEMVRSIGGYDEAFMEGLCYEDSDFVVKMWQSGASFIFCDDITGFHLEHKRDHLTDSDGRVTKNATIFKERYGDENYLRKMMFKPHTAGCDVGLSFWLHGADEDLMQSVALMQRLYGQHEEWRSIPLTKIRLLQGES